MPTSEDHAPTTPVVKQSAETTASQRPVGVPESRGSVRTFHTASAQKHEVSPAAKPHG
ncbi:hypothetical protein ACVW00_000329 [Marmoricola sp. URHA0025 HA25]